MSVCSESGLECHICETPSEDLRLLSCTHSFCLDCLQSWSEQKQNSRNQITCPECRQITKLSPRAGVAGLQKGISIRAAKQLLARHEEEPSGNGSKHQEASLRPSTTATSNSSCQFCNASSPLHARCTQCRKNLCRACADKHATLSVFRSHSLVAVSAIGVVLCTKHGEERVEYFCKSPCQLGMCAICVSSHDESHEVATIEQVSEEVQKEMKQISPNLSQALNKLEVIRQQNTAINYHDFSVRHHQRVKQAIQTSAEKAIRDVEGWRDGLLLKLQESHKAKLREYDEMISSVNALCEAGNRLMKLQQSDADVALVLKEGATIKQKAEDIKQAHQRYKDFKISTMEFIPVESSTNFSLGSLEETLIDDLSDAPLVGKSSMDFSTQHSASPSSYHLYCNLQTPSSRIDGLYTNLTKPSTLPRPPIPPSNETRKSSEDAMPMARNGGRKPYIVHEIDYSGVYDDVECAGGVAPQVQALAFCGDDTVVACDSQGEAVLKFTESNVQLLTQPGLIQPRGIATASSKDKIYAINSKSKSVDVFNNSGNKLSSWRKPELSFPKGIGVLKNGQVVVSDRNLCKIYVFDEAGKLRRSFGQKGARSSQLKSPGYLCVDVLDRILVTDYGNKAIKVFLSSGVHVTSIPLLSTNMEDISSYQSICTDQQANIYLVKKTQNNIAKLDKEGRLLGDVMPDGFLQSPCVIAMGENGLMAVGELNRRVLKVIKLY